MGNKPGKIDNNIRIIQDKREAQNLLNMAESKDFYLEECNDDKTNSLARRNFTYAPNNISKKEIDSAVLFIKKTIPLLPAKLSELAKVNIIQLMPNSDGGMPHTRPGNIICYPNFSMLYSVHTLIHELWHCHQREFTYYWIQIFNKIGWTIWKGKLPDKLENNRRYNPDTLDSPLWIFKKEWIPVPVFTDITHPSINQIEVWFYNPHIEYYAKNIPDDLSSYFTDLNMVALEHPREITAYMLAEPDKFRHSPAFKDLIKAMGNNAINSLP